MDYLTTNVTSSSTANYLTFTTTPTVGYVPVATTWGPQPARPQTSLEWLDAEVERTCALARAA